MYVGEPDFWGHGYAIDAAITILGYAFERMDLHLIELWTLADNDRAIRMYERCGFAEDGRLRERSFKEGRWVDHLYMSVSREEFARARGAWAARTSAGPAGTGPS
jgi:RimJ/RimL family protein N-acetyltransferase